MREDGGASLKVVVHLASALRAHAGDKAAVELDVAPTATVRDALDAVAQEHPAVGRRIRDETGALRRHVNVFVGQDNMRDLGGEGTTLTDGVEVTVLPAVSGG